MHKYNVVKLEGDLKVILKEYLTYDDDMSFYEHYWNINGLSYTDLFTTIEIELITDDLNS